MKKFLNWLRNEESGQGMVEYGLVIAVVAVIILVGFQAFGNSIKNWFDDVATKVDDASNVTP